MTCEILSLWHNSGIVHKSVLRMENNLKARTDMLSCFSETRNPLSETAKERMRGLKKKQEKGQEDMNNNKKKTG